MKNENPNYYAIIPSDVRYDNNLKDKAKLLYGEITALSDKYGYCYASNRYFAELYGISQTSVSLLIKNLIDNGYIESEIIYKEGSKEILNRYLKIIKGGYLKNFKEGIKENLKDNNTSNNNTSNNNTSNNIKYDREFEKIWSIYPKKQGKKEALKHFIKARKKGVDFDLMLKGLENYNNFIKIQNISQQYIKKGSTWFNQECWNDDYNIKTQNNPEWFGKEIKEEKLTNDELEEMEQLMNNYK